MTLKRREQPSLDGVLAKVGRANFHRECFYGRWHALVDETPCLFDVKTHRGDREHLWYYKSGPVLGPDLALIAGDCLHNLRSALDHLAWQLVLASKGSPTDSTAFPLRSKSTEISGGVTKEIAEVIDAVQPYQRTPLTKRLKNMDVLDSIDKHRHLNLFATMSGAWASPAFAVLDADEWPDFKPETGPLKVGKLVAKLTYPVPVPQTEPDLGVYPLIVFDKMRGLPKTLRYKSVSKELSSMCTMIEDDLLPMFARFF